MRRIVPDRRGLTLVELMVALALFAVITTVVISFLTGSRRTYNATSDRAQYQQSMRAVFSLLSRELRSAGCDPAETGLERLTLCDDDVIRCRMDLDGDGSTLGTGPDEDIRYVYVAGSGELQRTTADGTMTILHNLTGFQFRYFDTNGAQIVATPLSAADRDRVRFVDIDIVGEPHPGEPVNYSTRVFLRNG
ncbi:MAG: prepilin-type N-terminal cleavage/methylation domain-containing protein [Candidatus Krumholzibacteriia bacterium]